MTSSEPMHGVLHAGSVPSCGQLVVLDPVSSPPARGAGQVCPVVQNFFSRAVGPAGGAQEDAADKGAHLATVDENSAVSWPCPAAGLPGGGCAQRNLEETSPRNRLAGGRRVHERLDLLRYGTSSRRALDGISSGDFPRCPTRPGSIDSGSGPLLTLTRPPCASATCDEPFRAPAFVDSGAFLACELVEGVRDRFGMPTPSPGLHLCPAFLPDGPLVYRTAGRQAPLSGCT
jgi:hypothetical protein